MAFESAANVINDAAVQVGLASVTDPFGSTDPNFIQLCRLLKISGRRLRRLRNWTHLHQTYTLNTTVNVGRYAFPVDYGRFVDRTQWNRTTRFQLGGPVSPSQFQWIKARLASTPAATLFRQLQGVLQLYPDANMAGNYVIAYEYISNWWVTPNGTQAHSGSWQPSVAYALNTYIQNGGRIYQATTGGTSGSYGPIGTGAGIADGTCVWSHVSVSGADTSTHKDDTINFDPAVVGADLRVLWLQAKQFDSSAAENDLQLAYNGVADDDSPAANLTIGGPEDDGVFGNFESTVTGFGLAGDGGLY